MRRWLLDKVGRLSKTLVLAYSLFTLSALILIAVATFTFRVSILRDWHLVIPDGDFHAGDTIVIESVYTKLRPVKGVATRYLECKNEEGVFVRYPINEALADRSPGRESTGVIIKLPDSVPNLPATCHISINIDYRIYPWRTITEFASTHDFTLLPEQDRVSTIYIPAEIATGSPSPIQTSQDPIQSSGVQMDVSSPQNTTNAAPSQPDSSQQTPPQQQHLLQQASGFANGVAQCIMLQGLTCL